MKIFTSIKRRAKNFLLLLVMLLSSSWAWGQTVLKSGDFVSLSSHSYAADKELVLGDDTWLVSSSQEYGNVFYLGTNASNANNGILSDKWTDIVDALRTELGSFAATTKHAYAMRLQLNEALSNVGKVTINWTSANNAMKVYLFVNKGGGLECVANVTATNSSTTPGSISCDLLSAAVSDLVLVAVPTSNSKTLRISTYEILSAASTMQVIQPVLSGETTKFIESTLVTATCATDGATIHYTTNGETPTEASPVFPAGGLTISETTTINAIAVADGMDNSAVASATYTKLPVYTLGEVKALSTGTKDIAVKLTNAVVTGVTSKDVFVEDATGGIDLYQSGQSYEVGDILNGYVIGTYTVYNALPEFTSGNYGKVEVTKGGSVVPTTVTIAQLLANPEDYYCRLVKVEDVTYADGALSQNENSLALYEKFGFDHTAYTWPALADVIGVFGPYKTTMQLYIRTGEDIVNTSVLEVPTLSWSAMTYNADLTNNMNQYPVFTTNSDGAVSYASSDEDVATISNDGTITLLTAGTTVITASVAASATYSAAEVSYTLSVLDWSAVSALVAEKNGKYYAMSDEEGTTRLYAQLVNAVNGKVIKETWDREISWYVDQTAGTILSVSGKYVSHTSSTNIKLSATAYNWSWDAETGYWNCTTTGATDRSLGLQVTNPESDSYFRAYTVGGQYPGAITMPFVDGYVRTVTPDKFGTICLPCAVAAEDIAGATFYSIAGKRTEAGVVKTLVLTEETTLQAGVPYLFCATADKLVVAYNGAATTASTSNGLVGSLTGQDVAEDMYILTNNTIKQCGTGCTIGANRAYIDMAAVSEFGGALGVNQRMISLDGETAIDDVMNVTTDRVDVYTMSGVRVRHQVPVEDATNGLSAGLYVVGTKKVVVK